MATNKLNKRKLDVAKKLKSKGKLTPKRLKAFKEQMRRGKHRLRKIEFV